MQHLIPYIIKTIVLATFLHSVAVLRWRNGIHRLVLLILAIECWNEVINTVLILRGIHTAVVTNISFILYLTLWLMLLSKLGSFRKITRLLTAFFVLFAVVNLVFAEGFFGFNFTTIIFATFVYVSIFIVENYQRLWNEDLVFFSSGNYILLFSPVSLLLGLSFIFGFYSHDVTLQIPFGGITLWNFVIITTNIIYYSLLNIYIRLETKSLKS
ncbi:hypothetical protein [Flavobacterium pallidum]|uniref:Uncharacterized protein n=1 Tax=Flavobacterium pallidum TaxID=2172098 RepID=A0A2S1SHD9_9FLAO|nr:hypothetical protein [Flavobacterium pallidum]AWI25791.1 hypothetical protein HYN49_07685 [Flavobacterium pallidum]